MLKHLKGYLLFSLLLFLLLPCIASADMTAELTPSQDDIPYETLLDIAAGFFAEKCSFAKEALLKEQFIAHLMQDQEGVQQADGSFLYYPDSEPYWWLQFKSFPGDAQHHGGHILLLDRSGNLIEWSAHGAVHTTANPDILATAVEATPLPTDKQKDEIIAQMARLLAIGSAKEYTFQAHFVYSDHFNAGHIPVWLVYAYDDQQLCWKGAYAYNGLYMSVTPPEQDYQSYNTAGEHFLEAVYGDQWYDHRQRMCHFLEGKLSREEILPWVSIWTADFEQWAQQHPYSADQQFEVNEVLAIFGTGTK